MSCHNHVLRRPAPYLRSGPDGTRQPVGEAHVGSSGNSEVLMKTPSKAQDTLLSILISLLGTSLAELQQLSRLVSTHFPFTKEVVEKQFSLPSVDDTLACLSKDRLLPPQAVT